MYCLGNGGEEENLYSSSINAGFPSEYFRSLLLNLQMDPGDENHCLNEDSALGIHSYFVPGI